MKRFFILAMAAVATMCAAATQRFHIEDFSILPGDTVTVEMLLDNEMEFTAFQTDMYLPEGLTALDASFALTNRKSSSHTLSTSHQPDGAIRMMAYSIQVKSFSGNSGPLVTFRLAASEDFTGSAVITMRNILFTTVLGQEIPFENESCTVCYLSKGDVNLDGKVSIDDVTDMIDYILRVEVSPFSKDNADLDGDGNVTISDITDVIDLILSK